MSWIEDWERSCQAVEKLTIVIVFILSMWDSGKLGRRAYHASGVIAAKPNAPIGVVGSGLGLDQVYRSILHITPLLQASIESG